VNKKVTILIFLAAFLAGCQQKEFQEIPTPHQLISDPTVEIGSSDTAIPTVTATPVEDEGMGINKLENSCFEIAPIKNEGLTKNGNLVLYDRNKREFYKYIVSSGSKSVLFDVNPNSVSVSPDRKWLGYITGPYLYEKLQIQSFNARETLSIDLNTIEKWLTMDDWITNDMIIFAKHDNSDNISQPRSLIALNPFSGEKKELHPNFPDIYDNDSWGWDNSGRTLYSSDFRYVVYFSAGEKFGYALWDIENKKSITSIETLNPRIAPQWMVGGKAFIAQVFDEFYFADIDGHAGKLTDFGNLFSGKDIEIRAWSQSPNSRYIAFFMGFMSGEQVLEDRLMVLDTETGEVTDYCISGDTFRIASTDVVDYSPAPIWSPDGKALLIESRIELDKSRLILVDLVQKTATQIVENAVPFGWMLLP
jgi:hypothetical protein